MHWNCQRTLEGDGGLASLVLIVAKLGLGSPEWTLRDASWLNIRCSGEGCGSGKKCGGGHDSVGVHINSGELFSQVQLSQHLSLY